MLNSLFRKSGRLCGPRSEYLKSGCVRLQSAIWEMPAYVLLYLQDVIYTIYTMHNIRVQVGNRTYDGV